jgi:hypothetical protein
LLQSSQVVKLQLNQGNNMNEITLHRDDLETILRLVDTLNPDNGEKLGSGYVTIYSDQSSGIGQLIDAEVDVELNGLSGKFKQSIVDESSW